VGITTNPPLCVAAIGSRPPEWASARADIVGSGLDPAARAETLVRLVVTEGARALDPIHAASGKKLGYICGQVDPSKAGDRDAMRAMARRYASWAANVSIKLPATSAGIDVLEELAADGVPVTGTVSFSLSQLLAVAEAHERGARRAQAKGLAPAPCNAVLMIGRIDDYLMDVIADNRSPASPDDVRKAGLAIAKRGSSIFRERGYSAKICVAALRGTYHATELAGGDFVLSIHPKFQKPLMASDLACEERAEIPVPEDVLERLSTVAEFRKAYEPDGLRSSEFIGFGVTQRTLAQFVETGWKALESAN
jgi:transaldolase